MENVGLMQHEIVKYVEERLKEGVAEETIKQELQIRWPGVISERGLADTYLLYVQRKIQ